MSGPQRAGFIAFWGYVCISVAYTTFRLLQNLGMDGEWAVIVAAFAFVITMLKVDKPESE